MVSKTVRETAARIRALKIQGASAVRKAVVCAVKKSVAESKAKSASAFRKELRANMLLLATARPTEPETRTALRIILHAAQQKLPLEKLKYAVQRTCLEYEKDRAAAMDKIAEAGAGLIRKGSTVLTHCHSHTVEKVLLRAWKKKKLKGVIATETRPRWQGRITAANLARNGVPVTFIVDSAAGTFIKDADYFFTGADAVLSDGSVVNKIGTRLISLAAREENTPHFVCTSSFAFDPATFFGKPEEIEERAVEEVWDKKLKKVRVRNPAFDVTERELVKGIVTEQGIFAPEQFSLMMFEKMKIGSGKFVSLIELLKGK